MLTVGVIAALGVLCFWLAGFRFARIVVFLALGAICGLVFAEGVLGIVQTGYNPLGAMLLICCGWLISWPISRIPLYMQRRRVRQDSAIRAMIV